MNNKDLSLGYEYWLKELKRIISEKNGGEPLSCTKFDDFNLPPHYWYLSQSNISSYSDFIRIELGLIPNIKINKEEAKTIVKRMIEDLGRDVLYQKDFEKIFNGQRKINIQTVNRIFGNMNKMKEEMNLPIIQEDMICKHKTNEELLEDLKSYINSHDVVPSYKIFGKNGLASASIYNSRFGGTNNAFLLCGVKSNKKSVSLKLTNEEIIDIYKQYADDNGFAPSFEYAKSVYELPSPRTVIRRLGCSWNDFVTMLGYEPHKNRSNRCVAKDGSKCMSSAECLIHNYLLDNKVDNLRKEIPYRDILSDEELVKDSGFKRLDWVFDIEGKTFYVEYFGMIGIEVYDKKVEEKLELIHKDGKEDNFIAIYPKDIKRLDDVFNNKLKKGEDYGTKNF